MAKRQRVRIDPKRGLASRGGDPSADPALSLTLGFDPTYIAVGLLGGAIVYVSYYPSDSVAVEQGDALWFGTLAIVIATITLSARWWSGGDTFVKPSPEPNRRDDVESGVEKSDENDSLFASRLVNRSLDIVPWLLAAWMMLSAFASSPPGNLRMATNEAWLWVSAAAVFTAGRRLMASFTARKATLVLIVVCAIGLAVHGLHQYYVSLPANRLQYEQNPDRVLELAGVDAPAGSAERMVFENRLYDGGPTGTFALANSLAAVLLAGVVLAIGILRFHWHALHPSRRVAWGLAALLCASCLMAARSRSATLAMLVGMSLVLVASSRLRQRNPKALAWGLLGVSLVGIACAVFIALLGNREWFEEAPASLAVRFQYWRSTWQMVLDRPLIGAGPGNFQSIYERYREESATEQIAEPHNMFFETLSSGGFIGLGLLLLAIVSGVLVVTMRRKQATSGNSLTGDESHRWLWLGAILSLLMVWLIGWASRHPPDFQASLFVLPISIVAASLLWPSIKQLASRDLDSILGIAIVTLFIHLMVAGGWTVPGVAMVVWLCCAMLARTDHPSGENTVRKPIVSALTIGGSLAILAALYLISLRPVENQKRLMATTVAAQSSGQLGKARITLRRAVESDPWSPDAMLWLADFYRWQLILRADNPEVRRQWESSLANVKRLGGDDPAVYRMVGIQQLHVYQRHGATADLAAAAETFRAAVDWSPSNQWMMAQMAVVAAARGETQMAQKLAQRAAKLSQLGGNIERALSRQQVYVARPLGKAAELGPIRRPATELLSEPITR